MPNTIEKQTQAAMNDAVNHLAALQQIVDDPTQAAEARKTAATEIMQLTAAGQATDSDTVDDLPTADIADDDPEVLKLTAGLSAANAKLFAGTIATQPFWLGAKSLQDAKTIVAGRRRIRVQLARVLDESLPVADRLGAIRLVLCIMAKLAPLDCNEEAQWQRLKSKSPEWLLENIKPATTPKVKRPPEKAWDLW